MIRESTRKDKRFMLVIDNKRIHFGSPNGYTQMEQVIKENYLKRHIVNEDWTKINPALSIFFYQQNSKTY